MAEEDKKKLTDEEKIILMRFYKDNPSMWNSNSVYYKNREKKETLRKKMVDLFNDEYKIGGSDVPSKWKFYKELEFIVGDLTKEKKKTSFTSEEIDDLIDFYREHPTLWNHTLQDYRDRALRESLMSKLSDQFDEKFSVSELKTCWHNTLTTYKREKQREEGSKASGSGLSELYFSSWLHYNQMGFVDVTCDMDETVNSLEDDSLNIKSPPPPKKKRGQTASEEQNAKADLWKALTQSITQKANSSNQQQPSCSTNKSDLIKRAEIFGNLVADNLLQCDPRDWTLLKKKVMDLFFDYEQQKRLATTTFQTGPAETYQIPESYVAMLQPSTSATGINISRIQQFSPTTSHSSDSFN